MRITFSCSLSTETSEITDTPLHLRPPIIKKYLILVDKKKLLEYFKMKRAKDVLGLFQDCIFIIH